MDNVITEMYTSSEAKTVIDIIDPNFPIGKEVKQGDPLSPFLFNCDMEKI